jgi:hypothetical protein
MNESEQDKEHRQIAQDRLSFEGKKHFSQIEFDANEDLVMEIRKHKFGLALILLTGVFVVITLLGISIAASSNSILNALGLGDLAAVRSIVIVLILVLLIGSVLITAIAVFLFVSSVIFVTSEKIAQVIYVSLFHKKISQLSIGDIQDVTVSKKGIFAHIFNYGTLVVETAGEQQNYTFTYVPDPYQVSKQIVGAHERNLVLHGN